MTHSAEKDAPEDQGMRCGAQYGSNPDRCYLQFNHRGAHSNRWGTTWSRDTRVTPPAEKGHGLPFDPPEDDEPTCPTCGQALFTHGIAGRCTPPGNGDSR